MERDEIYPKAVMIAKTANPPSISNLQRCLMIGYNRASRLMDSLIEDGIVERFETENGIGYRRPVPNC